MHHCIAVRRPNSGRLLSLSRVSGESQLPFVSRSAPDCTRQSCGTLQSRTRTSCDVLNQRGLARRWCLAQNTIPGTLARMQWNVLAHRPCMQCEIVLPCH